MLVPFVVAALAAFPIVTCDPAEAPLPAVPVAAQRLPADSTLEALYASGQTYDAFLEAADARRAQWRRHSADATVSADALATARALTRRWRLLVIAVDGCSDSVNTIPYLARLVAEAPAIEMRVVHSDAGRAVMEGHRTPDGRAATPTVLVLDEAGKEWGCWVERPSLLQALAVAARKDGQLEAFTRDKQSWYDRDAGASTVREVVAVLAAADAGAARCEAQR